MSRFFSRVAFVVFFSIFSFSSYGAVILSGTRFVYLSDEPELDVRMTNQGSSPVLTQAWIDKGNAALKPGADKVPFVITPPISRVNPLKGQSLRITYVDKTLPKDRESVFWLNVLEIPSEKKVKTAESNSLKLAFRTRVKLFYRPADLKGTETDAAQGVKWSLSGNMLHCQNSSQYYVTIKDFDLISGSRKINGLGGMIAPNSAKDFPVKGSVSGVSNLKYRWISQFGSNIEEKANLL
ncbi:UNVERIFIED_CONTAM: hypothetical protein GTU68_015871 [Idotea baltica]|nr:hypothetical protein [Idotea baltica]